MKKNRVRDLVERTRKKSLISAVVEEEGKAPPDSEASKPAAEKPASGKAGGVAKRHVHIMMSEDVYTRAVIYQAKTRKFSRLSHLIEAALVEYLDRHEGETSG